MKDTTDLEKRPLTESEKLFSEENYNLFLWYIRLYKLNEEESDALIIPYLTVVKKYLSIPRLGNAFVNGTKYKGLPKDEKNALVSEYGQPEMIVLPNGKTILNDKPTLMDLPKDTVIFNEEQTNKIMDNKVDASGDAFAGGTFQASESGWRDIQTSKYYEKYAKLSSALYGIDGWLHKGKEFGKEVGQEIAKATSLELQKHINNNIVGDTMDNVKNISSITNNNQNVQQPVTVQIGDIHLTGVQDVDGLAQGIKTRLSGKMMQEYFKN